MGNFSAAANEIIAIYNVMWNKIFLLQFLLRMTRQTIELKITPIQDEFREIQYQILQSVLFRNG